MGRVTGTGLAQTETESACRWMAGDFGQIARLNAKGAEEFVSRINLKPGMEKY